MENSDIAISIKNVSKQFMLPHEKKSSLKSIFTGLLNPSGKSTKQQALKDISFDIKKGEFFGIVGRNGSGKSTLLKIIAGIYQPTKGSVQVNGKLVPFIELGVGFNPELSGRENVYLNGAILGFSTKQIDANYKKIVEFAELEQHMDAKLKNYSSGMQVRLAFACATMANADILLIDEVLAVGDADFQRKCFDYFKNLKKQGTTVILVTHDMSAVVEYCDKTALIDGSKVDLVGSPEKISEMYTKLFNENITDKKEEHSKNENRWGNNAIKFLNKPSIDINNDFINIKATASIEEHLNNPVFGVSIENSAGQVIVGTNSKILKLKYGIFKKGETIDINWSIPNILSSGRYNITIAAHSPDGVTVYDRWNHFQHLDVINNNSTSYIVSPKCELIVNTK